MQVICGENTEMDNAIKQFKCVYFGLQVNYRDLAKDSRHTGSVSGAKTMSHLRHKKLLR